MSITQNQQSIVPKELDNPSDHLTWLDGQPKWQPNALPDKLPTGDVHPLPALFQVRGWGQQVNPAHVQELVRVLAAGTELDPVTVWPHAGRYWLIAGHHRMSAHAKCKRKSVPVTVFQGSPRDAYREACREGSKSTLQMHPHEKYNMAWSLVRHHSSLSRREIQRCTSVSSGQIQRMRRCLAIMGDDVKDEENWKDALWKWTKHGDAEPMNDDERAAKFEAEVLQRTEKMTKAIGMRPSDNPELMAAMLSRYMGRRLGPLFMVLKTIYVEDDWVETQDRLEVEFGDF